MGYSCKGTCYAACYGCSDMCAFSAGEHPYGYSIMGGTSGVSNETPDTNNEKIKNIPTECRSCGAQAEVSQMGFLFIKKCPYCGRKEVISI